MDFTHFSTRTYSESNSNEHLHTELVPMKLNMGFLCLDNHHQSFWQFIDSSVEGGLAESAVDSHVF